MMTMTAMIIHHIKCQNLLLTQLFEERKKNHWSFSCIGFPLWTISLHFHNKISILNTNTYTLFLFVLYICDIVIVLCYLCIVRKISEETNTLSPGTLDSLDFLYLKKISIIFSMSLGNYKKGSNYIFFLETKANLCCPITEDQNEIYFI